MRRFFIILIMFAGLACQNQQEKKNTSDAKKAGALAKFEIKEEFHNFGTLQDGEIASYAFWYKNTGEAALKISGSETDCGCIQLSVPEEALMTGDSAYVEVMYNSAGEVGKTIKTVTLFANVETKKVQFHIAADVKNKWIELK